MIAGDEAMIARVLAREGGYVDHPDDRGGPTNYGITLGTLAGVRGRATPDDVRNLTADEARDIYRRIYLDGPRIAHVDYRPLRELVFDSAVNHGVLRACVWLQEAYNRASNVENLTEDGIIGPKTLDAVNGFPDPGYLYKTYLRRRIIFYGEIVRSRPSQSKFIIGWLKRVTEFL